jgi:hypothetical protein
LFADKPEQKRLLRRVFTLYRNKTMLRISGDFPIVPPPSMELPAAARAGATAKRLA